MEISLNQVKTGLKSGIILRDLPAYGTVLDTGKRRVGESAGGTRYERS